MVPSPQHTIRSVLMIGITIICIIIIISITTISFVQTDAYLKSIFKQEQHSTEDIFNKSVINIHRAYKLWDRTYNARCRKGCRSCLMNIPGQVLTRR